jgi:murein L,D-transpeptidase YcbB/YkuD
MEETTSDYYDDELVRMVEDFQRRHRLHVDGVAGVQTQMVLDTLNNAPGAPLLVDQAGQG